MAEHEIVSLACFITYSKRSLLSFFSLWRNLMLEIWFRLSNSNIPPFLNERIFSVVRSSNFQSLCEIVLLRYFITYLSEKCFNIKMNSISMHFVDVFYEISCKYHKNVKQIVFILKLFDDCHRQDFLFCLHSLSRRKIIYSFTQPFPMINIADLFTFFCFELRKR